jgi:hypothetical protein
MSGRRSRGSRGSFNDTVICIRFEPWFNVLFGLIKYYGSYPVSMYRDIAERECWNMCSNVFADVHSSSRLSLGLTHE